MVRLLELGRHFSAESQVSALEYLLADCTVVETHRGASLRVSHLLHIDPLSASQISRVKLEVKFGAAERHAVHISGLPLGKHERPCAEKKRKIYSINVVLASRRSSMEVTPGRRLPAGLIGLRFWMNFN